MGNRVRKILLVDGSNLLFQMFYGMPARIINHEGRAIQGTLGFVGALLKMIRMVEPTHVAVFFDGECENERTQIDGDYKANRPDYSQMPEEDTPFSQMPDVYAALDWLGIAHKETTDCETDDWIAGYAWELRQKSRLKWDEEEAPDKSKLADESDSISELVIASQDSDFFQLISDSTRILRYRGDKTVICDRNYIREKLGIEPEQYADFKSLTGDTADNIKGADKIGPKTAAALLAEYGNLENLIAGAERIKKPSVRESVIRNADRLRKNYELIRLDRGMDSLPFMLEEMAYFDQGVGTTEVLKGIGVRR